MDYRSLLVHVDDSDADGRASTSRRGSPARSTPSWPAPISCRRASSRRSPRRCCPTPWSSTACAIPAKRRRAPRRAFARRPRTAQALVEVDVERAGGARRSTRRSLHARYADLCDPRPAAAPTTPHAAFANDLVHARADAAGPAGADRAACRRRCLGRRERVLVAWKESRESARAVADALPFLEARARGRRRVDLGAAATRACAKRWPTQDIAAWLARHGIAADVRHEVAEDIDAGQLILSRAADFGADLIVMGAYSRPRLSEIVLGGVTRLMLESMTVPVLMSH